MFSTTGIKLRTKNTLKRRKVLRNVSFLDAKTIAILLDETSEKDRFVQSFIDDLKKKYDISILVFSTQKLDESTPQNTFSPADFNWLGKISKNSIHKFVKTPFDFLISLNTSTILYVENVLTLSQAKCRVGISTQENYPYLDFMIMSSSSSNWEKNIKDIKHYIENIAS